MNIYFFGYAITNDNQENNEALSPIGNNMQLGMLKEWEKILKENLKIYTFYPITPFSNSKKLIVKNQLIKIPEGIVIRIMPFINITIIKQICIMLMTIYYLIKDLKKNVDNNVVITYHVSFFYTIPVLVASKMFKFKTVCLISDAPLDYSVRKNVLINILKNISNKIRVKLITKYDGYLTINENVIKEFQIDKPHMPIYVGADLIKQEKLINTKMLKKPIKIVYTGAIEDYYNIDKLVGAMKILGSSYELHLYGKGSLVEKLNICEIPNVNYHGFINNKEIRSIQSNADILVCLLSKNSYLGKYAFPGKIFEYLLSGTPIISCRTPSIPNEMMPFLKIIESETDEGIASGIIQMTKSRKAYNKSLLIAERGMKFVSDNCTWNKQVQRIHEFIKELFD